MNFHNYSYIHQHMKTIINLNVETKKINEAWCQPVDLEMIFVDKQVFIFVL